MNNLSGKFSLITGATGLIGSHLARRLLREGAFVNAQGRSEEKLRAVFKNEIQNNNFRIIVENVANRISDSLGEVDYIFHAASPISGAMIKAKPVDVISANINGVGNCLEYLKKQGHGRMIVFSSATVYGNQFVKNQSASEEFTESAESLNAFASPYSESKRMSEVLSRAYLIQYGVDSVIARISYAYGYALQMPSTAFYEFIKKAINAENIVLTNSGMPPRDNIHIDDVVNGLLVIAGNGEAGEAYNLSSNGEGENFKAVDEIAQIMANIINRITDNRISVISQSVSPIRKFGLMLDNTKLKKLGWTVNVDIYRGIENTINEYIQRGYL